MEGGEGGVQSGETAVLVAAALLRSEASSKAPEHLSRSEKKRFYKLLKRQADTREEVLRQEAAQVQRQASPEVPLRCVINGSPQKRGVSPIDELNDSSLKKALKKEHDSRIEALRRIEQLQQLRVAAAREVALLQNPPPIVKPKPVGYHLVRMPKGIEVVTPDQINAAACMAMMNEAFCRLKVARASEHDVQQIMINLALVHDSSDAHAAEIDFIFDTYGLYLLPFLPSGRCRAHQNDRSVQLLQPALLDASTGRSRDGVRWAKGGGAFDDIAGFAIPAPFATQLQQRGCNIFYTEYHDRGDDHLAELGRVLEVVCVCPSRSIGPYLGPSLLLIVLGCTRLRKRGVGSECPPSCACTNVVFASLLTVMFPSQDACGGLALCDRRVQLCPQPRQRYLRGRRCRRAAPGPCPLRFVRF